MTCTFTSPEKMLNCFNCLLSTLGAAALLWAPPESLASSGRAETPCEGNSFQLILSRHQVHDQRRSTHMSHSLSERNHTLLTFCCWRVQNNHIWYRNLLKLHTEVIFNSFPPVYLTHTHTHTHYLCSHSSLERRLNNRSNMLSGTDADVY